MHLTAPQLDMAQMIAFDLLGVFLLLLLVGLILVVIADRGP